jgi:hypothetical protein
LIQDRSAHPRPRRSPTSVSGCPVARRPKRSPRFSAGSANWRCNGASSAMSQSPSLGAAGRACQQRTGTDVAGATAGPHPQPPGLPIRMLAGRWTVAARVGAAGAGPARRSPHLPLRRQCPPGDRVRPQPDTAVNRRPADPQHHPPRHADHAQHAEGTRQHPRSQRPPRAPRAASRNAARPAPPARSATPRPAPARSAGSTRSPRRRPARSNR